MSEPTEPQQDVLLDHNYDGIQEYDNPLPGWWMFLFWATIVFSPVYIIFYHFGPGRLPAEQWAADQARWEEARAAADADLGPLTAESLRALQDDEAAMADAESAFRARCTACHGPQGQGNAVGPNLTDDHWLHGGSLLDIHSVIANGVDGTAMIPWEPDLGEALTRKMAAYIGTLRGTNPPDPKDPEGEEWTPPAGDGGNGDGGGDGGGD